MCANYVFDCNRNLEYALTLTLGKVENVVLNAFATYNFAEKRRSKSVLFTETASGWFAAEPARHPKKTV